MKNLTTPAAAIALALAFIPAIAMHASAQSMAFSTVVATDHSMRSSKLIGMDVFNSKGEKIGKIEDILVKGTASEPLVVLSAGTGNKMVAVPLSHIALKDDKASMAATTAEMAAMPAWKFTGIQVGGGGG